MHNIHTRNMPDVQKDVEFVMEHLNDPNFDLTQLPSSVVEEESTKKHVGENGSGGINFDESVLCSPSILIHIFDNNYTIATHHIQKYNLLSPMLTIPRCQSTPSACGSWEFSSPSLVQA